MIFFKHGKSGRNKNRKSKSVMALLLIIVIVVGGYFFFNHIKKASAEWPPARRASGSESLIKISPSLKTIWNGMFIY
jgi:hypothetical protein